MLYHVCYIIYITSLFVMYVTYVFTLLSVFIRNCSRMYRQY